MQVSEIIIKNHFKSASPLRGSFGSICFQLGIRYLQVVLTLYYIKLCKILEMIRSRVLLSDADIRKIISETITTVAISTLIYKTMTHIYNIYLIKNGPTYK